MKNMMVVQLILGLMLVGGSVFANELESRDLRSGGVRGQVSDVAGVQNQYCTETINCPNGGQISCQAEGPSVYCTANSYSVFCENYGTGNVFNYYCP